MPKILSALAGLVLSAAGVLAASNLVYIGTYTNAGGRGIYATRFDSADGTLSPPFLAVAAPNPAFLAFGRDHKFIYAIDEYGGYVSAFSVDAVTGRLTFLNHQPSGGASTAHLAVDPTFHILIIANYGGGSVGTFPLGADGQIGARSSLFVQHGRFGPNPIRQTQSRPHSITLSPDGRFAFICDLGQDEVFVYKLDLATALLLPTAQVGARTPPGSGPRHSVFSADARFFYVINEMGGSVSTFAYDAKRGELTPHGTLSSLPADFSGVRGSAEIAISPNGKWLYVSNRGSGQGSDSLATFSRDSQTGQLALAGVVPSGGGMPRNFALSPDGNWILCANQNGNNIIPFRLDSASGQPVRAGAGIKVSRPVCLLFQP